MNPGASGPTNSAATLSTDPAPELPVQVALGAQGVLAARWGMISSVLKLGLTLGSQIWFARLLGPETYGIFATAMLATMLIGMVSDLGMAWTVLQRPQLDSRDLRWLFTWVLVFSVALSAAVMLAATPIAGWLGDSRAAPLLAVLVALSPLSAVSAIVQSLLLRSMRSRELAVIQLLSYALGFCVIGVLASLLGAGAWSMVIGVVGQSLLQFGLLMRAARPGSLRPLFVDGQAARLFKTSRWAMLTVLTNWAVNSMDRVVVSRVFGPGAMGQYTNAVNLAGVPTGMILGVISPVLLTLGSQVGGNVGRLASGYRQMMSLVFVLLLPVFVVAAVDAPALVALLFGEQWQGAGVLLAVLLCATPFTVAFGLSTPVIWNSGHPHLESLVQWPFILAAVPVLILAASYGLAAVAVATAGIAVLRALLFLALACRKLQIPLTGGLLLLGRGVFVAAVAGAVSAWTGMLFRDADFGDWLFRRFPRPTVPSLLLENLACLASGTATLMVLLLIRPSLLDPKAWELLLRALPARLRPALRGVLRFPPA